MWNHYSGPGPESVLMLVSWLHGNGQAERKCGRQCAKETDMTHTCAAMTEFLLVLLYTT